MFGLFDQSYILDSTRRTCRRRQRQLRAMRFAVDIERVVERRLDLVERVVHLDKRVADQLDLDDLSSDDRQIAPSEDGNDATGDIVDQNVRARLADMTSKHREIGDFRQDHEPPISMSRAIRRHTSLRARGHGFGVSSRVSRTSHPTELLQDIERSDNFLRRDYCTRSMLSVSLNTYVAS